MKSRITEFWITEDHLTLARAMYVGWCGDEYGAPEIDPKRPYGNSDVEWDILRVLDRPEADLDEMPETLSAEIRALHESMQTALQIILRTGSFAAGRYVRQDLWSSEWRRATKEAA